MFKWILKIKSKKRTSESGQSTVEFLITFAFSFSLIFMFLRLALNYAEGYVIHYANFMASRAYMVHDINASGGGASEGNNDAAEEHAKNVLEGIYPQLDPNQLTVRHPSETSTPSQNVFTGTYYQFNQEFSLPFSAGGAKELNMRSESFLGREPTRDECLRRICNALLNQKFSSLSSCEKHVTLSDNGC